MCDAVVVIVIVRDHPQSSLFCPYPSTGRGERREGGTPSSTTEEESLPIDDTGGEEEEEEEEE